MLEGLLKKKNYKLNNKFNIFIMKNSSKIYIKGSYGVISLLMPSLYFYKIFESKIVLIFIKKFLFYSFVKHFFCIYKRLYHLFSVRLKVRGLGYRVRKISES